MKIHGPHLIYRCIKKIPIHEIPEYLENSEFLNKKQLDALLSKSLAIEEKIDGKLTAYANRDFVFFCRDMLLRQNLFYKVPAKFALIDVLDKKTNNFLGRAEKEEIAFGIKNGNIKAYSLNKDNLFLVPLVESGKFNIEALVEILNTVISAYAYNKIDKINTYMHGIVAKPYSNYENKEGICGELIRIKQCQGIDFNMLRARQERNEISKDIEKIKDYSIRIV